MANLRPIATTLFAFLTIFVTACGGGSGGGDSTQNTSFQGVWLAEEILEFREDKDPNFICQNIELWNGNWELRIDGFDIDGQGGVRDFSLYQQMPAMWKVRADGTTYDNLLVQDQGNIEGAENLVSNKMELIDENTLTNTWTAVLEGKQQSFNPLFYYR